MAQSTVSLYELYVMVFYETLCACVSDCQGFKIGDQGFRWRGSLWVEWKRLSSPQLTFLSVDCRFAHNLFY